MSSDPRYILIGWLFTALGRLPVRLMGALGAGLGRVGYLLDKRHRQIALRNLARIYPESIYPEKSARWREQIARASFAELGRTLFELPWVLTRSRQELLSRFTLENPEMIETSLASKRGVVLCACHHGNWELGALAFSLLGYSSSQIYRPLGQNVLNEWLLAQRSRFGALMKSRTDGLSWLPRVLRQGGVLAVMVDQHLSNGVPVPFLGHLANSTTLPATIARRYGANLLGVALLRIGNECRFRLRLWPIALPELTGDAERDDYEIMCAVHNSFAPMIDERPERWLWSHRRWRILDDLPSLDGIK